MHSFAPVINLHTRVLIVGSMPGEASLLAQEYYAYKHNQFWKLIFDIFEQGRSPLNYTDKKHTLLSHQIGLWDSLATCTRTGSLDSAISHPKPNDFPALFKKYPAVHTLLFNGQAAARYFKKFQGDISHKTFYILPSTSPAHATLSYLEKRKIWERILQDALKKPYAPARELL